MKKIINLIKNNIFGFIIGVLITSSVGIGAATLYFSNEVSYTPTDTTWNVDNVKEALDELYSIENEFKNNVSNGYSLVSANFFSGQANVSSGSFSYTFLLTDTTKTGIKFLGSFSRGISAATNCTLSQTNGYYYVAVTDKTKNFVLSNDLASSQTAYIHDISTY